MDKYKQQIRTFRSELRRKMTPYEKILWRHIRKKQIRGYRFLRQYSVGQYILDFYCPSKRLGIEVDGQHHYVGSNIVKDFVRTNYLNQKGVTIIRFTNTEVMFNIDKVLQEIVDKLN